MVLKFFATCPKGLEYLLVDELKALGASEVHEALAGAHFSSRLGSAALDPGYRACLWSRLASRVLLPIGEFAVANGDDLYAGVRAIDWSEHLAAEASFAVDATGSSAGITHSQFAALRVKDAIVDQFRELTGARPDIDTERPSVRLNLLLRRGRAIVSIDLSGTPLHQRGYRLGKGLAPLKENLAAGMLLRAGWPNVYAGGGGLVDPMCGSGTLLVEAALMAADIAPGLRRDYFGFLGWRGHDAALWKMLHDEAEARASAGAQALRPVFFGFDQDGKVLNEAVHNAQCARMSGFVHLGKQSLEHLHRPHELATPGLVICNPPYGERMTAQDGAIVELYRLLGRRLKSEFPGWRASVITSDAELGRAIGLSADKKYKLYNGALECVLLNFAIATAEEAAAPREVKPLSPGAQMVKNRIEKTYRHLRKRAEREGVECWRVYDADLPEYAAAIDLYRARPIDHATDAVDWLHVQEYQAPASVDENLARTRLRELVRAAGEALGVPRERIALKQRSRGRGGEKYGRMAERGEFLEVGEGGLHFLVNLHDYLDTGLFLDHRPLRATVRELARGKRFLNLFCYTGSVSVYAAAGGAAETTSVDLSATYLDWATQNLQLNGFGNARHKLVQADALEYLQRHSAMYDLIFVDPPTFSNSKRADDFDVQRDHVRLLQLCGERLLAGGLILFSNNSRRFKLDAAALPQFAIKDISAQTIPFDFERNKRIHQAWELRRK